MDADQLLKRHVAEIDAAICDGAREAAQHLLDGGASLDDLPRLMEPFVQYLAEARAAAVAKLQANARRMREIEATLAYLERVESGAKVH